MRGRQVYASGKTGKSKPDVHICGCVKMHLFSFLCECVMMKTVRSGKDEQDF